MRRNPRDWRPYPKIFKTARRRIETSFSQLCDQMMLKRNYAKSFIGLRARLIAKVTAVSLLQYINEQNDRPIKDRKSTRLNSSHVSISHAVFCLKKQHNN